MLPPFLVRADADGHIGTGHVMRCLALAQAWQDAGGQAVFLMTAGAPELETRLHSEGMEVVGLSQQPGSDEDAFETQKHARKIAAPWVVVDGYHFGARYQKIIKDSGRHLLFVDDTGHAGHYAADVVLNQNIHASETIYPDRDFQTRLLLGTRFALLRREFLEWHAWKREVPDVARKVLVTLGGSDPDNVTLRVIRALELVNVDRLEVIVLAGPSNSYHHELCCAAENATVAIRVERHATNMPELMAWADVAIAAAGSTSWELSFMGLPSLLIVLASNQRPIADGLAAMGIAQNLTPYGNLALKHIAKAFMDLSLNLKLRTEMSQRGRNLVDGKGASRVAAVLREFTGSAVANSFSGK